MSELPEDSLVAKRQRFIQRQIEAHPERTDVTLGGRDPQGSGPENRHGMPALPVGQRRVTNWPVLDLGVLPRIPEEEWRLKVGGEVEQPVELDFEGLLELPQEEDVSDFHCVTGWSRFDNRWTGVRFRTLAELVVPKESAAFVICWGYDCAPGTDIPYTTSVPLERALDPDVFLVHRWEGEPLPVEHGGPVRMITPRLYAWKGTKWIRRIEFASQDTLGFWEVRGYSNSAQPWLDDRYSR